YAKEKAYGKIKSVYIQTMKICVPFAILGAFIVLLYSLTFSEKPAWQLQIQCVALTIPAFTIFQVNNAAISGLKEMTFYSVFKNIFLIPFTFILTFLISFHYLSISYALIAFTVSCYLGLAINTFYLFKRIKFFDVKYDPSLSRKELLAIGFPMLLTTATSLLITSIDILMLGYFKGTFEVGIYDIAIKFSLLAGVALLGINAIATPKFSEFYSTNNFDGLKRMVRWSSKFIFWSTTPVLVILLLFPELILSIYGEEFPKAATALVILTVGQFISSISGSVGNILKMTDNHKVFQNIMIVATLLNIVLNIILIPLYGINGAAIATSSSIIFYNLTGVYYVYKKLNLVSLYLPLLTR
ncbi:MAG: flippase, partial [Bacteroidota bacterium]